MLLEVNEHKVEPGDIYLMCSDGLSDMVDDGGIARILASDAPLEQKVVQLIDTANANGGPGQYLGSVGPGQHRFEKTRLDFQIAGKIAFGISFTIMCHSDRSGPCRK